MKTYLALVLFIALIPFGWLCAVNYYVDPFQYFRKATRYEPRMYADTRFMNAGFARHYDYDSIVIGTSMAENFRPSQIDSVMGGRFIKLSMAGALPYEEARLLQAAFSSKGDSIRSVVWGVDQASWVLSADRRDTIDFFPDYLYSGLSPQLISRYLASKDVYYISLIARGLPLNPAVRLNFDILSYWSGRDPFGCRYVRHAYELVGTRPNPALGQDAATLTANVDANLRDHLIPVIQGNPRTVFYLFIPPYSAADALYRAQHSPAELPARLYLKQRLTQLAASQTNVRFYDFQSVHSVTDDLANYEDIYHYSGAINDWMISYMHSHDGLPAEAGYVEYAQGLRYDKVFKGCAR